jgi:prepilin-type N-terminal cleavage/methylation domain-containing protein
VERGVSLAELLVALALAGLVLAALAGALREGERAYRWATARLEAQQGARVALERMAREIRGAGVDPRGVGFPALVGAGPTGFTLQSDLDGDGIIRGNPERVTYSLTGRTLRRNAGGGAQPLIEGVESLLFEYLDASGAPTEIPERIRSVRITLATGSGRGAGARMTTEVRLRNR